MRLYDVPFTIVGGFAHLLGSLTEIIKSPNNLFHPTGHHCEAVNFITTGALPLNIVMPNASAESYGLEVDDHSSKNLYIFKLILLNTSLVAHIALGFCIVYKGLKLSFL